MSETLLKLFEEIRTYHHMTFETHQLAEEAAEYEVPKRIKECFDKICEIGMSADLRDQAISWLQRMHNPHEPVKEAINEGIERLRNISNPVSSG